ncbi:quinone oxidoreductase family protein [Bordetella petrii]|uniref:quinone oxidoreductase family protein n=1 Tax=Bordetella petrii TaxID=94624 RepID=UPI001A96B347|nr:quinone oxidoreductase [Bordetella petrii]MBO1113881.1 quinone oxidoreductase [Bordetella petrii]
MDQQVELIATGDIGNFKVVDCAPRAPGPGEIRLRHEGIGVNFIDIYHRLGLYPLPLPAILGVEGAGVVEAVGAEAGNVRVGDRVAYAGIPGAYAATRLLPAWRAVKLPDDVGTQVAAVSFLRGITAHMLLTGIYPVAGGTTLLVHAAAGGLGAMLTRWAKHLGGTVIGTASSPEKAAIARAQGADHVIVGRDADVVAEVGRLTGGKGVDFAVDGIGGAMLRKTLASTRRFGVVASVGQAAGPIPPVAVDELRPMLVRPSVMAYAADQDTYAVAAQAVIAAIRQGIIQSAASEYPLARAAQAHSDLESGKTTGSLVLVP